jgi:hypothetical protein
VSVHSQSNPRSDPFTGVWKLNATKSTTSLPAPKAVRIDVDKKQISYREEASNGEMVTTSARFDGKDYPIKGSALADAASYERLGQRAIKSVVKDRGRILVTETMTVSKDGKTLTVVFSEFSGVAVFERQ